MNETKNIGSITDVILEPIKKMPETLADMTDSDLESDYEPVVLTMGGTEIDSLAELRERFVLEEAIAYVQDRTLIRWLKQLYYEKEAAAVRKLRISADEHFTDKQKRELCEILGVPYQTSLVGEAKDALDKHIEALKRFTHDETVLKNSAIVALNQKQLAKLLNDGEKKIYLCHNEFSIPLKKTGIHYIGVDNPVISNPFTAEQFKKLNITMENINLPTEIDPETESTLNHAASENGYDCYYEKHSDFENAIHTALKCEVLFYPYHLTDDSDDNYFQSKYECEKAGEACIRKAYDEAHDILSTSYSDCILNHALDYYCGWIERCFNGIMPQLEISCQKHGLQEAFSKLKSLVEDTKKTLKSRFAQELEENSRYYHLYHFSYFRDKVTVQRIDYGVDGEGLAFLWGVLTGEGTEYCFEGALDAIIEMNNDLEKLVATFVNRAHEMYRKYVEEIESCIQPIAKALPAMNEKEKLVEYINRINR